MARRRMFSPDIVSSDDFLDMPTSSRELYFQLGMAADDDGFVTPKRTMRAVGASDDDLKILLAKNFVIPFESGVLVIKHWKIHNRVRPDMYRPTLYTEEFARLFTKPNMAYTLDKAKSRDVLRDAQRGIGKDRLGKDIYTTKPEEPIKEDTKMLEFLDKAKKALLADKIIK